ncbi:MAG: DUF4252 domain-containing protein [Bacteroidales bacterium]|nr:DUF4252 domain-containing protein [Bacteroidales bacterium]MCF8403054.1 DUF4252 domain-containing protein [Bacteroidales bacterium]
MKTKNIKMLVVALLMAPIMLSAQSPADALFDKYSGQEGFTSVYITQHMFSLFANVETPEEEEGFMDLIKGLKCIKIITVDEENSPEMNGKVNFYAEVMKDFPKDMYEELMVVKKKDQDIKFLILKKGQKISELLMIVGGIEDNALISIQGDINLKTISKLSKSIQIEGMENLEEIDDNQKENK